MLTVYEGRFGIQLDPARITHVEDVYDLGWARYARVHFKWSGHGLQAKPCTVRDDDGDLLDALVSAGVRAA
jgi:hypothetical protein